MSKKLKEATLEKCLFYFKHKKTERGTLWCNVNVFQKVSQCQKRQNITKFLR